MLVAVLAGFGAALLAPFVYQRLKQRSGWLIALVPMALFSYFVSQLPDATGAQSVTTPWVPELGVNLSFRTDGLSLLFALLISGIGTLVVIYAGGYLKGQAQLGRFYAWLLMFMAAMLGVVLADNVLLLFVFWELTSFTSFMLIGFNHEDGPSRGAALQALLVTASGGLALLAGLVMLGFIGGTFELSRLLSRGAVLQASPWYAPALILVLLGAFTKSAQFPFHFWLPNAMAAPTPVSAYLHSATMVKAGIYLLARLNPALGGTDLWLYLISGAGLITMLLGGYLALSQTDLKRLLAYSTVSALGMLTLLIGLGTALALEAAMAALLAHALYKGALFLVAGAIDHETGTRDVRQLGGLARLMPRVAVGAMLAALSMAGMIPLFGFIAKELVYETALETGPLITTAIVLGGLSFVFVAGVTGFGPFLSRRPDTPKQPHEAPPSLWLGPIVLGGLSLIFGLLPGPIGEWLIGPAASAASGHTADVKLALWHGITPVLLLSLATIAVGTGLYAARSVVRRLAQQLTWRRGLEAVYAWSLNALNVVAHAVTHRLQNGYLRYYLITIVLTTVGLVGLTLIIQGGAHWPAGDGDLRFYEVGLAVLILLAAGMAITTRSRLSAVAALGVVGYGIALIYLLFGAPDLAMTQLLIESLTVILFVLAFYHLPRFTQLSSTRARWRDAIISLFAGGLITLLVLSAIGVQLSPSISDYFAEVALPQAHGRNVDNVILIDFRGLDTLGEVTVLGIAAIGVYALLKLKKIGRRSAGEE
jgi:multicomponent Na+:H+ antiporter subunit A